MNIPLQAQDYGEVLHIVYNLVFSWLERNDFTLKWGQDSIHQLLQPTAKFSRFFKIGLQSERQVVTNPAVRHGISFLLGGLAYRIPLGPVL